MLDTVANLIEILTAAITVAVVAWKNWQTLRSWLDAAWTKLDELLVLLASILDSATLPQYQPHAATRDASPILQERNPVLDSRVERSDTAGTREAYRPSKPQVWDHLSAGVYETAAEHLDKVMRDAERALTYNVHEEMAAFDAQKSLAAVGAESLLRDMDAVKAAADCDVQKQLADMDAQKALATRSVSEQLADLDAQMALAMLSPAEHMRRIEEDIRMASSGHALDALR